MITSSLYALAGALLAPQAIASSLYSVSQASLQIHHLSPLISYSPPDAWTHDVYGSTTNQTGASVSINFLGGYVSPAGYPTDDGATVTMSSPLEKDWDRTSKPFNRPILRNSYNDVNGTEVIVKSFAPGTEGAYDSLWRWRNISWAVPAPVDGREGAGGRTMNVTGFSLGSILPMAQSRREVETRGSFYWRGADHIIEPTINPNNDTNQAFYTVPSNWTVIPLTPNVTKIDFLQVYLPTSPRFSAMEGAEFINRTVLSIDCPSSASDASPSPLEFQTPKNASMVQIYGSVGPHLGSVRISLLARPVNMGRNVPIPALASPADTGKIVPSQEYFVNTNRPVNATGKHLVAALIDARTIYTVRIEPFAVENGEQKSIEINGATFTSYMSLDPDLEDGGEDWLAARNLETEYDLGIRKRPLSGGQIAGIVVGSVAGAALLGIIGWCIWREVRKNRQDAARNAAAVGVEDDQRTISGSQAEEGQGGQGVKAA